MTLKPPVERQKKLDERLAKKTKVLKAAASGRQGLSAKPLVQSWNSKDYVAPVGEEFKLVVLDPLFEIDSDAYTELEQFIVDNEIEIMQKISNLFQDHLVVKVKSEKDVEKLKKHKGVDYVVQPPLPHSQNIVKFADIEAFLGRDGGICTKEQALKQLGIIDVIHGKREDVLNDGSGVTIVVWDFAPEDESILEHEDFTARKGGKVELITTEQSFLDMHGTAVASTACGKNVGLAQGSRLILLGSSDVTSDLTQITKIVEESKGPVVVNMSFTQIFKAKDDSDVKAIKDAIATLNSHVKRIQEMYPSTMFIVAAGNFNINVCDSKTPITFNMGSQSCNNCILWPQSMFGEPAGVDDIPYVFVGATEVVEKPPHRVKASYSHFGSCVHLFTHGGPICALDEHKKTYVGISGTSFASPIVASLAALHLAKNPNKTAKEVAKYLIQKADESVELDQAAKQSNTTPKFAVLSADDKGQPTETEDKSQPTDTGDKSQPTEAGGNKTPAVPGGGESTKKQEGTADGETEGVPNYLLALIVFAVVLALFLGYQWYTSRSFLHLHKRTIMNHEY